MFHPASDCYEVSTLVLQFNDLIMHHLRADAAFFTKLNIQVYFTCPFSTFVKFLHENWEKYTQGEGKSNRENHT